MAPNIRYLNLTTLDECLNTNLYSLRSMLAGQNKTKRTKTHHNVPMTFGVLRTRHGAPKAKTVRILFDGGASGTLVQSNLVEKLRKKKEPTAAWTTAAGTFDTQQTV
jgi:hypothetical protein